MKYCFILFTFLSSIASAQESSVKKFLWLEGTWKQEGKDAYEKWQAINDTMLGAVSYHFIEEEHEEGEQDIIFDESIRFVARNSKFYYITKVNGQNNKKEVEFKITSLTQNSFIAENINHDFPKRIVYKLERKNRLHAYIAGAPNGKKKKVEYHFIKTI